MGETGETGETRETGEDFDLFETRIGAFQWNRIEIQLTV